MKSKIENELDDMLPLKEVNIKLRQEKEKIKEELEENTENYNNLPKELLDKNWTLNKNELLIPYTYKEKDSSIFDKKYFFSITKEKDYYYYTWKCEENGHDIYGIHQSFKTKNFLTIDDPKRNKKLGNYAEKSNLPRGKDIISTYWQSLILPLNKYKIKKLLDNNTIQVENKEENPESSENNKPKYETFEDYPDNIKKIAKEEVEKDNIINNIEYCVSLDHSGNHNAIKTDIFSNGTLYIKGKPTHLITTAVSGGAKTSMAKSVINNYPECHIQYKRSYSAKSDFYLKEMFHDKYNILILDDFIQSKNNIETAKQYTDNEEGTIKHYTSNVDSNGTRKGEILELNGKFLVKINSAKQIEDTELNNRCMINNPQKDELKKESIFNKILEKETAEINDNEFVKTIRLVNQASIHYLSEIYDEGMLIFNPYSLSLTTDDIESGRTLTQIIGLIKGRTFYSYAKRRKIKNIVIGSKEDLEDIMNIWSKTELEKKYKLHPNQIEILKLLSNYSRNNKDTTDPEKIPYTLKNFNKYNPDKKTKITLKYLIDNYDCPFNGKIAKASVNTITNIAKKIGENRNTVNNWIRGSKTGTQQGLLELKLVDIEYIDEENKSKGALVFINEKYEKQIEAIISNKSIVDDDYIKNKYEIDNLNQKIRILNLFLSLLSYNINKYVKYHIEEYCNKNDCNINTYDNLCDFIENFIEEIENKNIKSENIENMSFSQIKDNVSYIQKNHILKTTSKTNQNSLNKKIDNKTLTISKINKNINSENQKQHHISNASDEILETLKERGDLLITELIKYMSKYDEDDDTNYWLINQEIEELAKKNKVSIYDNDMKISIKKSHEILKKEIYEKLRIKNLSINELIELVSDIRPNLDNNNNKKEKIEKLLANGLLIEENRKLSMSEEFKNSL